MQCTTPSWELRSVLQHKKFYGFKLSQKHFEIITSVHLPAFFLLRPVQSAMALKLSVCDSISTLWWLVSHTHTHTTVFWLGQAMQLANLYIIQFAILLCNCYYTMKLHRHRRTRLKSGFKLAHTILSRMHIWRTSSYTKLQQTFLGSISIFPSHSHWQCHKRKTHHRGSQYIYSQ